MPIFVILHPFSRGRFKEVLISSFNYGAQTLSQTTVLMAG
jgi:hypothetical protein